MNLFGRPKEVLVRPSVSDRVSGMKDGMEVINLRIRELNSKMESEIIKAKNLTSKGNRDGTFYLYLQTYFHMTYLFHF